MKNFNDQFLNHLSEIDPEALIEYLQNQGWKEVKKIDTRGSLWSLTENAKQFSVLLPLETDLPDFFDRMYELFKVLELVEKRPWQNILTSLTNTHKINPEKNYGILTLKFKFLEADNQRQFSAKKLGNLLTALQNLFDAIGRSEYSQRLKSLSNSSSPLKRTIL